MFLFIDRYKLGILTAFAVYIGVFIYLEMQTYRTYFPIEPFYEQPIISIKPDELLITQEQVQVEQDINAGDLKNISRDQNDSRQRSSENWQENKSAKEIEQSVKDYEKSLYQDNGGELERAKILKESEQRKNDLKKQAPLKTDNSESNGSKTAYAGNVMVNWSLSQRTAHLNNNWYVRNPGYTCGQGSSGKITVQIKVNQNGSVIDAIVLSSGGASDCMTQQAIKYAKLSRFNYSSTASPSQVGTITYTFVSQ